MKNMTLHQDYLKRAGHRLAAIEVLHQRESWADVVRESQEVVELALKALLRIGGIEVPRIHDVGEILQEHARAFPTISGGDLEKLIEISHDLRRDRELAFYGSEDLTPSEFYKKKHADAAKKNAAWVVKRILEVSAK